MKVEKLKVEISMDYKDTITEVFTLLLVIFTLIYTLLNWFDMPKTIPTHFNLAGEADEYGSKITLLLILMPTMLISAIGLKILTKYPHVYNYVVEINEKNASVQYTLAVKLIRILNFWTVFLFSVIQFSMIQAARNINIGSYFNYVIITITVLIFIVIGIYIYKSIKNK